MPAREPRTEGRLVRKALLESERWLTLKDNADRLAYVWLLLNVDDYANYSAERFRLMRAWRDYGITTLALVSKTLTELQDHDMIGLYDIDGRPFMHLMRLDNQRQWWTRIYPQSPFSEDQDNPQKQRVSKIRISRVLDHHQPGVGVIGEAQRNLAVKPSKPKKPKRTDDRPPGKLSRPLSAYSTSQEIEDDVSKLEAGWAKDKRQPP